MSDRRASGDDRLDRMLRACDPLRGRVPAGPGIGAAFDSMTAGIVSEPRQVPRRWRFARRPRGAIAGVVAFAVLSAGVAVAATQLFVPTHTHQYVPKGMAVGGGPGELLNLDGTDFHQIALQISSDIPYPAGYGSWRNSVISFEYEAQCHRGPTGRCQSTAEDSSRCAAWRVRGERVLRVGARLASRHDDRAARGGRGRIARDLRRVARPRARQRHPPPEPPRAHSLPISLTAAEDCRIEPDSALPMEPFGVDKTADLGNSSASTAFALSTAIPAMQVSRQRLTPPSYSPRVDRPPAVSPDRPFL
jgi:hypothetical protein